LRITLVLFADTTRELAGQFIAVDEAFSLVGCRRRLRPRAGFGRRSVSSMNDSTALPPRRASTLPKSTPSLRAAVFTHARKLHPSR